MSKRVLILCTGNSCRSQMAEGLWRMLGKGNWECFSAGSKPAGYVHPMANEVMQEIGVDLSTNRSKHVEEFAGQSFDLVVTVCDSAKEACPVFPGAKQMLHWPFDDPAHATGSSDEVRNVFRLVRSEIADRIQAYLAADAASHNASRRTT
jgi:arsenate reductase (thioredoxin)